VNRTRDSSVSSSGATRAVAARSADCFRRRTFPSPG
jgi:hypothetical protein